MNLFVFLIKAYAIHETYKKTDIHKPDYSLYQ